MKRKLYSHLVTLAVMAGLSTAFGAGLVDLGPAGPTSFDAGVGNDKAAYIVDVSKDGTLAGGTDSSGNPFIWTAANGTVSIGTSRWLVGVDWLITNGVSTNVLAIANDNTATTPWYWQGAADGSGASWTSFPLNGSNPWVATALGVGTNFHNIPPNPIADWWVAGYKNYYASPYEYQLRFQNSTYSATTISYPGGGHVRCFFYAASDEGTFAGVAQCGGGAPDGGARNGEKWYAGIVDGQLGNPAYFVGPPEVGNGSVATSSGVCIADAISGDGTVLGGVDKTKGWAGPRYALFWAKHLYVYELPWIEASPGTYATFMGIRAINGNGKVMGGYYYADPPDNTILQAFAAYNIAYTEGSPTSVTCDMWKVGDLLAASGINTNGWTFQEVTALSTDGNTLAGYGETNGVVHGWLAQITPVIQITNITVNIGSGTVTIDFTSSSVVDTTASFAVQQCGTVNGTYSDTSASFSGTAPSFEATLSTSGDVQFYRIRHL